jgi:hypothetical protein
MSRYMFLGVFTPDHCRSEDGIGRSQAGGNDQRREKVKFGNERVNERSGDKPPLKEKKKMRIEEGKRGNSHAYVMTGKRRKARLFQCLSM